MIISMENEQKLPVLIKRALGLDVAHEGHIAFFAFDGVASSLHEHNLAIESQQTIGFLYGFHHFTKLFPIPTLLLEMVNRFVDKSARFLYPKGGHILFFAARKGGNTSELMVHKHPFQCPKCVSVFKFGDLRCMSCGFQIPYTNQGILNAMEFPPVKEFIASSIRV